MDSDDSDEDFVSADEGDDDEEVNINSGIEQKVCKAEELCDKKENLDDDQDEDTDKHREHEKSHPEETREVEGTPSGAPEEYVDEDKKSDQIVKEDIPNTSPSGDKVNQLPSDEGTTCCSEVTKDVIIQNSVDIEQTEGEESITEEDVANICAETSESIDHKHSSKDMEDKENASDNEETSSRIEQLTIQDETTKCEEKERPEKEVLLETTANASGELTVNESAEKEITLDVPCGNITVKPLDNIAAEEPFDGDKNKNKNDGDNTNVANTDESWGWDSWADDFISQATATVSTLMETVEGQLGIPDPTLLAQDLKVDSDKAEEMKGGETTDTKSETVKDDVKSTDTKEEENVSSWFSSYIPVAQITNLVQSKGQELVSGGIDALEFIGKSTVNYLSEGDPGLRNKRKAFLRNKGETLSSILNEAKVKAEERQISESPSKGEDPKKLNDMLEKFQAIAHLDALQMLSSSCQTKLERILNVQSDENSQFIDNLKEKMEIEENEENKVDVDFKKDFFSSTKMLKMKVTCSKLLNTWTRLKKKTDVICFDTSNECFENCISSLAEFVSRCTEYHRKVADMLIMADGEAKQLAVERATILKSVSEMFLYETADMANKFANYLANNKEDKVASDFITDIYLETANSSALLQDSHLLLLPILQCSAIK